MAKPISLAKIRLNRESAKLLPRSYKMHPVVCHAFEKRVIEEGTSKISLLEKMIVKYLNEAQNIT